MIVYELQEAMIKLRQVLRSVWFKLGLVIAYFVSPQLLTSSVWDMTQPQGYYVDIIDVLHAQFDQNGDVKACLLLKIHRRGKPEMYQVMLPIADLTRHDHPMVQKREATLLEWRKESSFRFRIDEDQIKKGCDPRTDLPELFVGRDSKQKNSYGGTVKPNKTEFQAELHIGFLSWEIYYINREPLRHIHYKHSDHGGAVEIREDTEYNVEFVFPKRFTGARWWYLLLLPPAVVADALLGPWEWWRIFTVRH